MVCCGECIGDTDMRAAPSIEVANDSRPAYAAFAWKQPNDALGRRHLGAPLIPFIRPHEPIYPGAPVRDEPVYVHVPTVRGEYARHGDSLITPSVREQLPDRMRAPEQTAAAMKALRGANAKTSRRVGRSS